MQEPEQQLHLQEEAQVGQKQYHRIPELQEEHILQQLLIPDEAELQQDIVLVQEDLILAPIQQEVHTQIQEEVLMDHRQRELVTDHKPDIIRTEVRTRIQEDLLELKIIAPQDDLILQIITTQEELIRQAIIKRELQPDLLTIQQIIRREGVQVFLAKQVRDLLILKLGQIVQVLNLITDQVLQTDPDQVETLDQEVPDLLVAHIDQEVVDQDHPVASGLAGVAQDHPDHHTDLQAAQVAQDHLQVVAQVDLGEDKI